MPTAMEQLENEANDLINRMRRANAGTGKQAAANHPRLRELAGAAGTDGARRDATAQGDDPGDQGDKERRDTREGLEGGADALIAKMRSAVTDNAEDPQFAANGPKLKEIAYRLSVARKEFRSRMDLNEVDDGDVYVGDELAPGQEEQRLAETPPSVLSSPYAGMEPRYVVQHDGHPDPIAKAKPTPPSEAAGARTEDEARVMREQDDASGARARQTAAPSSTPSAVSRPAAERDDKKR